MNTYLLTGFSAVIHKENGITEVRGARIYTSNPVHDGEYVCDVDFDLFLNDDGDMEFRHAYAVVNKGYTVAKGITKVDPYRICKAMELVIDLLESGEVCRLENQMMYSENEAQDL